MDDRAAMETVDATQPTVAIEPVGASRPAVAVDPAGGTQPLPGGQPLTGGAAQPVAQREPAPGDEPCAHCGAPLARDQRYCLECGAPRTYLSGMLLERLRAPGGQARSGQPGQPAQAMAPNGMAPYTTAAPSSAWPRNNVLTLIAGIGVLLLAMGVGVLIGRSGGSSAASTPAPQVTVVGGGAGATGAGAATTPTTTTPEEAASSAKKTGSSSSAEKASKAKLAPGVGSVPSKPAPPTVLKNLRKKSGESYEQKSKNLPNVVETG
jgi:hypothetical protein